MLKIKLVILMIIFFSNFSFAGEIANGKVEEVTNIVGNTVQFGLKMSSGGVGPCANEWIYIKLSNTDIDSYKNAFSLVTAALFADKRIRVHNYNSDDCMGATFIGVYKN